MAIDCKFHKVGAFVLLLMTVSVISSVARSDPLGDVIAQRINEAAHGYEQACDDHNVEKARLSLKQMTRVYENLTPEQELRVRPESRTRLLFVAYGLSYSLERAVGNDELAEINLVEAKYWWLKALEADGHSEKDVGQDIKSLNGERILQIVAKSDKSAVFKRSEITKPTSQETIGPRKAITTAP